jgi:threonine dehydratase
MDVEQEVLAAEQRIRPHIRETYVEPCAYLQTGDDTRVSLKLENLQHTGSFKVRGALNKILSLADHERARGVVTASTGNHGAAVAYALGRLGSAGVVFVPPSIPDGKRRRIEQLGAEVRVVGHDPVDAERHARRYAAERGLTYVSPYNDPKVLGGQGTLGVELHRQIERFDAVFVALGGGGLISGVAGYLKAVRPDVEIIACSPENSPVMMESVKAGRILEMPSRPTLSEGTAGGVEAGSITFETCRDLVDDYVSVSEAQIAAELLRFVRSRSMLIEGAAAVALASYRKLQDRFRGRHAVIVLCGGNIDPETLLRVQQETKSA